MVSFSNMTLNAFIKKRPYLIWYTKHYENLSIEAIVESVLNYGDFDDVMQLFKIKGIKVVGKIFYAQIKHKRNNYRPEIKNYFDLYFKKYA